MASIRKEISVACSVGEAWDAIRDVGAVHQRLAKGFVTDTQLDAGVRIVTFRNGFVARELIVDLDDSVRRLAYTVVGGHASHHHASFQVTATDKAGCRIVWITDVLPHELADVIRPMIEQGTEAIRRTLDGNDA